MTISKTVIYVMHNIGLRYSSKFEKNLTTFRGVMAEKPQKNTPKWYFLLVGEHLKIHNVATTIAILMKLTTLMYRYETFIWQKIGVSPIGPRRAWSKNICKRAKK